MATKRFNYLGDFSLDNTKVGIGTSNASETLEVVGGTTGKTLVVAGIATLSSYSGFNRNKTSYTSNVVIDSGESGTLSGEVVVGSGLTMIVSTGATTGQGSVNSLKVYTTFTPPVGFTSDRPIAPQPGSLFYNRDLTTIEFWDGAFWRQVDNTTRRGRGLNWFKLHIDSLEISTLGNAVEFGDGYATTGGGRSGASSTRGMLFGGRTSPATLNTIEYVTIASAGNGIDFGDMTRTAKECMDGMCSSTRLLMAGGKGPSYTNTIDYVEMQTLGDAIDFGDMTTAGGYGGATNSPVRGIFAGGEAPSDTTEVIEYLTIASKGNANDFGDLIFKTRGIAGGGNAVRGIFAGGERSPLYVPSSIQYITLASKANAQYFGDITVARGSGFGSAPSNTRCVFVAGEDAAGVTNVIDYVTIESSGNAVNFGDLMIGAANCSATSDSHGGLGGF